jgi:hypothetical protein
MLHMSPQSVLGAALGVLAAFPVGASASWKNFQPQRRTASSCPDYNSYSEQPHGPYSSGALKLPYMRPSEECRTFTSPAVEVSFEVLFKRMEIPSVIFLADILTIQTCYRKSLVI